MSNQSPVPNEVIVRVAGYASKERQDIVRYDNREAFDESGMYDLHVLAQQIYREGWEAGMVAASLMRIVNR